MQKNLLVSVVVFLFGLQLSHGQILISLLLGDKLNSGKVEFGLDGGLAVSELAGMPDSKSYSSMHLGFYFDIKMKENFFLHTGVIVKSNLGAKGIPYNLNEEDVNPLFSKATATRKLNYFNIPIYAKYKFYKQFYFEAGPQIGIRYKAKDLFTTTNESGKEITLESNVKDQYHLFDVGVTGGLGYKLMKGTGINLGLRYYAGLLNIAKDGYPKQRNNVFYVYAGIPIGAGKSKSKN
jgi:hypothetical protein